MSQKIETVELSTNMDQFIILSTDDKRFVVKPKNNEYHFIDNPDLPAIPMKNVSIIVPNGAELIDYKFSIKKKLIRKEILMDHSPSFLPVEPSVIEDEKNFSYTDIYPQNTIDFSSTTLQRGYTQFNFTYIPFVYDGNKRELNLVSDLKLEIEYTINESKISSVHPDESVIHFIKSKVVNPDKVDRFYPVNEASKNKKSDGKIDYLIVTSEDLKDDFKSLLEWKQRKGLNADIISVEEIEKSYDEPTTQLKIKRCLHEYYEKYDLKWVLLGGDESIIPVQNCYSKVNFERSVFEDWQIPTDLFYACFDYRFDWNSIDDDKIGEIYMDGHDLTPEIFLTRMPVRTKKDVEAFVKKTMNYEIHPSRNESIGKMIFGGVKLWSSWEGKSDSHHRSDLIFKDYINLKWKGEKYNFFDTGTDFTEGPDYQVTSGNLTEQLNQGFGYFHFTGHGNNTFLIMESGKVFHSIDAMNLNNEVSGVMLSNACNVNAFDISEPSLSEALLRNPDGGCVAFFGSSRYGFGNPKPSIALGASLKYNANFMKHLFTEGLSVTRSFGEIASSAKGEFSYNGSSNGVYYYLMYAINPMGDPELPLYTGQPQVFDNVRLYKMGNSLTVNTGGVENSKVCITSLNLEDGHKDIAKNVAFHTFHNIPGEFQITITAPNYIPYTYISGMPTGLSADISSSISVFPNPANEDLRINFNLPEGSLQIFDISGKLLKELTVTYGPNHLNISDVPDGLLILKFSSRDGVARFKVLKQGD